jgi:hypothetical protein
MRGGGSSGLPYIKPALPEDSPAGEYLAGITRTSADFPLRGGTYSTIASTEDTIRVSRFLNDFPKGAIFTSKQVGLQKSNPRIETGQLGSRLNTQTYNLNANLIAQVAEQGTGVHINRAGFNTNELRNDRNKYAYIVSHKSTNDNRLVSLFNSKISGDLSSNINSNIDRLGISNNPNALFDYIGGPDSLYGDGNTYISRVVDTNESYQRYKQLGYSNPNIPALIDPTNDNLLLSKKWNKSIIEPLYPPISTTQNDVITFPNGEEITVEGVTTSLPNPESFSSFIDPSEDVKYQQSSPDFIRPKEGMLLNSFQGIAFNNTLSYKQLLESKNQSTGDEAPLLQDFRLKTSNTLASNYNSPVVKIESRLKLGDPGARKNNQRNYINQVNDGIGQDKINLIPLYSSEEDPIQTNSVRDIIKFCIEVMDNNNPNSTVPLHFRAYITDLSDNIGADWSEIKYMGRGENFYTYQGFSREVSFNLKVAAHSKQEMMPLYQKLNYLASSLMPDYSNKGFMRGNLHKLTVGEWFYRTPGVLKSMNISIDNDYSWEIKFDEPETGTQVGNTPNPNSFGSNDFQRPVEPSNHKKGNIAKGSQNFQNSNSDADMMELPQILSINFTFIPILKNLPRLAKDSNGNFTATPILISDHGDRENFLTRINYRFEKPQQEDLDPDITPINTGNN